jgi:hypothetical protein
VECKSRVVVDGVDDDLHQMNLKGFNLRLFVGEDLHSQRDELGDVIVDVSTHVEHDYLCEFAATDTIDASNLVILENRPDHIDDCVKIWAVLNQCLGSIVDKVLQSGQHV